MRENFYCPYVQKQKWWHKWCYQLQTCITATTISKMFEHYFLSCISPFVGTTGKQFVFKPQLGTDMCAFLHKEILSCYVNKDTSLFLGVLGESKMFYRNNHNLLFAKTIGRNVWLMCHCVISGDELHSSRCFWIILNQWFSTFFVQRSILAIHCHPTTPI